MKDLKRLTAALLLTLLVAMSAVAAPLTASQKSDIVSQINKAAASMRSMSCSFTQTKHLALLSDKMTSQGKMYYKQPEKLRWEYTSPYQFLFIFNGTKVYVGNKSRKDVIDTKTNKVFKEVARIMMSTVTGTALSNTGDFTIDVADTPSAWQVTLLPKKKEMKMMFAKVLLTFSKADKMISEVTIFEKNNDRTNIKFRNIQTNQQLNEALFAIPK